MRAETDSSARAKAAPPQAPAKPKRVRRYDPVLIDQRSRIVRRTRAIEKQLRAEIERLGRVVTVHDDILVGQLATCMVRSEVLRGEASRGAAPASDEVLTRLANAAQRLVGALGLKPQVIEEKPDLDAYLKTKQERPA
jgi:hypothetical protein